MGITEIGFTRTIENPDSLQNTKVTRNISIKNANKNSFIASSIPEPPLQEVSEIKDPFAKVKEQQEDYIFKGNRGTTNNAAQSDVATAVDSISRHNSDGNDLVNTLGALVGNEKSKKTLQQNRERDLKQAQEDLGKAGIVTKLIDDKLYMYDDKGRILPAEATGLMQNLSTMLRNNKNEIVYAIGGAALGIQAASIAAAPATAGASVPVGTAASWAVRGLGALVGSAIGAGLGDAIDVKTLEDRAKKQKLVNLQEKTTAEHIQRFANTANNDMVANVITSAALAAAVPVVKQAGKALTLPTKVAVNAGKGKLTQLGVGAATATIDPTLGAAAGYAASKAGKIKNFISQSVDDAVKEAAAKDAAKELGQEPKGFLATGLEKVKEKIGLAKEIKDKKADALHFQTYNYFKNYFNKAYEDPTYISSISRKLDEMGIDFKAGNTESKEMLQVVLTQPGGADFLKAIPKTYATQAANLRNLIQIRDRAFKANIDNMLATSEHTNGKHTTAKLLIGDIDNFNKDTVAYFDYVKNLANTSITDSLAINKLKVGKDLASRYRDVVTKVLGNKQASSVNTTLDKVSGQESKYSALNSNNPLENFAALTDKKAEAVQDSLPVSLGDLMDISYNLSLANTSKLKEGATSINALKKEINDLIMSTAQESMTPSYFNTFSVAYKQALEQLETREKLAQNIIYKQLIQDSPNPDAIVKSIYDAAQASENIQGITHLSQFLSVIPESRKQQVEGLLLREAFDRATKNTDTDLMVTDFIQLKKMVDNMPNLTSPEAKAMGTIIDTYASIFKQDTQAMAALKPVVSAGEGSGNVGLTADLIAKLKIRGANNIFKWLFNTFGTSKASVEHRIVNNVAKALAYPLDSKIQKSFDDMYTKALHAAKGDISKVDPIFGLAKDEISQMTQKLGYLKQNPDIIDRILRETPELASMTDRKQAIKLAESRALAEMGIEQTAKTEGLTPASTADVAQAVADIKYALQSTKATGDTVYKGLYQLATSAYITLASTGKKVDRLDLINLAIKEYNETLSKTQKHLELEPLSKASYDEIAESIHKQMEKDAYDDMPDNLSNFIDMPDNPHMNKDINTPVIPDSQQMTTNIDAPMPDNPQMSKTTEPAVVPEEDMIPMPDNPQMTTKVEPKTTSKPRATSKPKTTSKSKEVKATPVAALGVKDEARKKKPAKLTTIGLDKDRTIDIKTTSKKIEAIQDKIDAIAKDFSKVEKKMIARVEKEADNYDLSGLSERWLSDQEKLNAIDTRINVLDGLKDKTKLPRVLEERYDIMRAWVKMKI